MKQHNGLAAGGNRIRIIGNCVTPPRVREGLPRRVDDDCLQELRWLYDHRDLTEARRDLAAWLAKWSGK